MRAVLVLALLLLVTACMPSGPTGNAVAPPTRLDDSTLLISTDVMEKRFEDAPVRITVSGEIVYRVVQVDGEEFTLSGDSLTKDWLSREGTLVTWLPPGRHEIRAFSCFDSWKGYQCGCVDEGDCGHWMIRWVVVP